MKVTLTESEIREALAKALEEKTSHIYDIDPGGCYFANVEIDGLAGSDHTVENIEFEANVGS